MERGFGSQPAIIHDSPVTDSVRKISFKELLLEVGILFELHSIFRKRLFMAGLTIVSTGYAQSIIVGEKPTGV